MHDACVRRWPRWHIRAGVVVALSAALLAVVGVRALAAGSPTLVLTDTNSSSVLYGTPGTVTLTASNPTGQPEGYNLSIEDVLPAGISYVAGSAGAAGDPQIIPNEPATGDTTLIWSNLADLSAGSTYALEFRVTHNETTYQPGSTYTDQASAYVNTNPRQVPTFSATGVASSSTYTGSATSSHTHAIVAMLITKSEPSPEGELMRGVHEHQTTYTLTVTNNAVDPTANVLVDDYMSADLEYLGCGSVDNTTDASATNPGSTQEYPNSGPLSGRTGAPSHCATPTSVATAQLVPPGSSLPNAVYTHVQYTLGTLAPGETQTISYLAGVPIRENTTTFAGSTPSTTSLGQEANLDNNNGPETTNGEQVQNFAIASGNFNTTNGVTVSDNTLMTRTAEDLAIQKTVNPATVLIGQVSTWTMHVETSEYRYATDVSVNDTLPSGLCPLDPSVNYGGNSSQGDFSECAPQGGTTPSLAYSSVTEHPDGTYTIAWNPTPGSPLVDLPPNTNLTITYPTATRSHFQENDEDAGPILSGDTLTNTVVTNGTLNVACVGASGPDDCSPGGEAETPHPDRGDGEAASNPSSASQTSALPSILKQIAVPGTEGTPADCANATYESTSSASYGPGDEICYELTANFPPQINTGTPVVTDFMPPGTTFVSDTAAADNTVTIANFSSPNAGELDWTVDTTSGGAMFDFYVELRYTGPPTLAAPGTLTGNLMKLSNIDTPGETFPARASVDFNLQQAQLSLLKGVASVNGQPSPANGPNVDHVRAGEGATVLWRDDVTNEGNLGTTTGTVVWDPLPSGLTCADVVPASISDGGSCDTTDDTIKWTALPALAAGGGTIELTYSTTLPTDINPNADLSSTAGVVSYASSDNQGGTFTYIPASNVDPGAGTTNATAASDRSDVYTPAAAVTKVHSTSVIEGGNTNAAATIGETIDYTVTFTIPAGTTVDNATLDDPQTPGRADASTPAPNVNQTGGAPVTPTLTTSASDIEVSIPGTYDNTASTDAVFTLTYAVTLSDVAANARGGSLPDTATFGYQDSGSNTHTLSASSPTPIVEPDVSLSKTDDSGGTVTAGQIVRFTLTGSNPNGTGVSTAHDLIYRDHVPSGLTPVDPTTHLPIADGGTVGPDGGVWNAGSQTITWTQPQSTVIAPAGTNAVSYDVSVDAANLGHAALTNTATLDVSSLAGGGRDGTEAPTPAGYQASTSDTLTLQGATLTKSVSDPTATVGETVTYTLTTTVPANEIFHDFTIEDTVPDGVHFLAYGVTNCSSGCGTITPISQVANADGTTTLGWFVGELPSQAAARTITVIYTARVGSQKHTGTDIVAGNALTNTAADYWDTTQNVPTPPSTPPAPGGFDDHSPSATSTITVAEPALALTKATSAPTASPGNTVTYTLTLTNNGSATAYDATVSDTPPAGLADVTPTTGASDLTGAITQPTPSSAGLISWTVPTLAAGASAHLVYTATVGPSSALSTNETLTNTATDPAYYGLPAGQRSGDPDARSYTGSQASATVTVHEPALTIAKTTGLSGNPATGAAQVGAAFPWRVVVTNSDPVATADAVTVTDTLPANWTYDPGSAQLNGTPIADPTITTAGAVQTLTWTAVGNLGPSGSLTLTYGATPQPAAETNPGLGAGNPNINSATATATDPTGASSDASGPYVAGPASTHATLEAPLLTLVKDPKGAAATAGAPSQFTLTITNTGTATAHNVEVIDTLPSGLDYSSGSATAVPASGFSETSVTAGPAGATVIEWALSSLASGAHVVITMPVAVAADVPDGSTLTNSASVTSDETPTPVSDSGSLDVSTLAAIAITKTAPASDTAGQTLTWTITTTNNGPSDAQNVTVTDPLPSGTTFTSLDDTANCAASANVVTCSYGTLGAGASETLNVTAAIGSSATGVIANTATVATTTTEPPATPTQATASTTLGSTADVSLTKTAATPTVAHGRQTTFTLTAANAGPSDAQDVTIVDHLPSGLTYVSASPTAVTCTTTPTANGTDVTCPIGTLASGENFALTLTVAATNIGAMTNTAEVSSTTTDPDSTNDQASAAITVVPAADLGLTKTAPATVSPGGPLSYSLTVTNNGPDTATGVTITDPLPAGETFSSGSSGCTASGQLVTCAIADLANGAQESATITVTLGFSLAGQTAINTAAVSAAQVDVEPTNNSASAMADVGSADDVGVTETTPRSVPAGGTEGSTDVITNHGASSATDVALTEQIPAGATLLAATPSQGACTVSGDTLTCALGTVPPGGSVQLMLRLRFSAAAVGQTLSLAPSVTGAKPDSDPANNATTANVTVTQAMPTAPRLTLTKRALSTRVAVGDPLGYRLEVRNQGGRAADHVEVTDSLSSAVRFLSATPSSGSCTHTGAVVRCDLGRVAAGANATIALRVRPIAPGTVTNTASVTASNGLASGSRVRASAQSKVVAAPTRLTVVKHASQTSVLAGHTLDYAIVVRNVGHAAAVEVSTCERLPSELTYLSAPGSRMVAGNACWRIRYLAPGAEREYHLATRVRPSASGAVVNAVSARARNAQPVRTTATTRVTGAASTPGSGGVTG